MAPTDGVDHDALDSPRGWIVVALAILAPVSIDAFAGGGYRLPLAALGAFTLVGGGLFCWGTDPVVGE